MSSTVAVAPSALFAVFCPMAHGLTSYSHLQIVHQALPVVARLADRHLGAREIVRGLACVENETGVA